VLLGNVAFKQASPKWLLNGLPKSGLHLITLLVAPLAAPPTTQMWRRPDWWGDLKCVWTAKFKDDREIRAQFYKLADLRPSQYMRSHTAYREDVADFIDKCGISHVFIYRDPRDVAVSQAYHVLSDDDKLIHDDKTFYRLMDGFDEVLMTVIQGAGPYVGVMERWELFAPWLECERVHAVKFEDAVVNREEAAKGILLYGINRLNDAFDLDWRIDPRAFQNGVDEMVKTSYMTDKVNTYRKGVSGEWKREFKPEHVEAFKATDVNGWLVKLGYESDDDWGLE
jgi:hypothetical protein